MPRMKLKPNANLAAMDKATKGFSAALASFAAKEDGWQKKMEECGDNFSAAMKDCYDSMDGMGDQGSGMPATQDTPVFSSDGQRPELPADAGLSLTDQNEPQQAEFASGGFSVDQINDQWVADMAAQYSSGNVEQPVIRMLQTIRGMAGEMKRKETVAEAANKKLAMAMTAVKNLNGRLVLEDFKQFCTSLRGQGHDFTDDMANQMFSFSMTNVDPKKALENAKNILKQTPKKESLASIGQVTAFDAAPRLRLDPNSNTPPSESEVQQFQTELAAALGGREFSAVDVNVGVAFSAGLFTDR